MKVITRPYSEHGIHRIHQILLTKEENGGNPEYVIFLDQIEVISRTDDLSIFYNFKNAMDEYIESLEILIFNGRSQRYTKHRFHFEESLKMTDEQINGLMEENKEFANTKKELSEAHEKLEKQKRKLKKQKRIIFELRGTEVPVDKLENLAGMVVTAFQSKDGDAVSYEEESPVGSVQIERVESDLEEMTEEEIEKHKMQDDVLKRISSFSKEKQEEFWQLNLVMCELPDIMPKFIKQINTNKYEE